jgi:MFS family permease
LIVLILILLKGSKVLSRPRIDIAGASFFFGAVLFLMLTLNLIGQNVSALSITSAVLFLALSLFLFLLFFHQEKKKPNPILDVVLLKSKPFMAANLYNMIVGAGVLGVFAFVPLYATSVHNLSTLMSGMILTPRSLAVIPVSAITSFFLKRWGYRWPMLLGLSILSLATILLGQTPELERMIGAHFEIVEILSFLVLFSGMGTGIAAPASNNACIELMPEKVATITGLRGMFRTVGGALGVSLITVILHLTSDLSSGFKITFISFGIGLLFAIPLVFLMPSGRREGG